MSFMNWLKRSLGLAPKKARLKITRMGDKEGYSAQEFDIDELTDLPSLLRYALPDGEGKDDLIREITRDIEKKESCDRTRQSVIDALLFAMAGNAKLTGTHDPRITLVDLSARLTQDSEFSVAVTVVADKLISYFPEG